MGETGHVGGSSHSGLVFLSPHSLSHVLLISFTYRSVTYVYSDTQIDAHADTCVHTQRHTDTYIDT